MDKWKQYLLKKEIKSLKDIKNIQCSDGNWNHNSYMHGMANGLIMALSMLENKNPKFLSAPKEWTEDRHIPISVELTKKQEKRFYSKVMKTKI